MDIAVVQTKEGSSLQFLLVILLEWEEGGLGGRGGVCEMEAEGRGWLLCHRKHMLQAFISRGQATPAPPQLSRQSGTVTTGGNLWKDHSPQPQAWKDYVFIL